MLKTEEMFLIRDSSSQNLSISKIAEQTGFDRKTVRKYLSWKPYQNPRNVPKEKASLILSNLTFLRNSMEAPKLLYSATKPNHV